MKVSPASAGSKLPFPSPRQPTLPQTQPRELPSMREPDIIHPPTEPIA